MHRRPAWLSNFVRAAISAASAFIRLRVLRIDRLSDVAFYSRCGICIDCERHIPGAGGQLGTCGRLVDALTGHSIGKPCGCRLRLKARDCRARCPEGRWVVVDLTFSKIKD